MRRMCHRYNLRANLKLLIEHFGVIEPGIELPPASDRFPLYPVAAIRPTEDDRRELVTLDWGFLPRKWKPTANHKTRKSYQRGRFNARCETVDSTWAYRDAFKSRRCLIPATAFFEFGRFFHLPGDRPFAFAGLYDRWEGEGEVVETCTFLTTAANDLVAEVHPKKRMPVVLDGEPAWQLWLNPDIAERGPLESLFAPYDPAAMRHYAAEEGK